MSPTIVLKARLERQAMKLDAAARRVSLGFLPSRRSVSMGSEFELRSDKSSNRGSEDAAALLLLSMSNIVSKEITNDSACLYEDTVDDDEESSSGSSSVMDYSRCSKENGVTSCRSIRSPTSCEEESDMFTWNRVRTVSIDSPVTTGRSTFSNMPTSANFMLCDSAIVSPMNSPVTKERRIRKSSLRLSQKARREHTKPERAPEPFPTMDVGDHKKRALQSSAARGTTIKKILRKKFSWKNYPGTSISKFF
jgi:hypothetical protein